MYCNKCGTEIEEKERFCSNCGKSVEEIIKNNKKIKFRVADVVNKQNVLNSTNKVAYIANGWAVQVRNRGGNLAIIIGIIYFIIAISLASEVPYYSTESSGSVFLSTFGIGILYSVLTYVIFNTVAFVIRMGAEVIQLLDDIKTNKI